MHYRYVFMFCVYLHVGVIETEVVNNFDSLSRCGRFFYKGKRPSIRNPAADIVYICQKYNDQDFYATLYDKTNRIPVYSAVQLIPPDQNSYDNRLDDKFFIEPKLAGRGGKNMIEVDNREHNFNNVHKAKFGKYQALDIDYKDSGYDRGHLNPQIFNTQNKNSRYATNTLTNIAPQYGPFNQVTWNIMENGLVNAVRDKCNFSGAKSYVVIGVQPSNDKFITRTIEKTVTTSKGKQKTKNEYENRVNVPDFYWTAICCDTSMATNHTNMGWSFGYKANNINEKSVLVSFYPVHEFLSNHYSQIFEQGCEFSRNNTIKIIKYIKNSIQQGPIFEANPTERFET
ncbi:endonuclease domain-containing 1 protein-like [Mytilus edulis]|uniref:endonuclease domain-containing 1 protein-like n=1 Tax=Mytilus edulis TaxID=6550 RepID=UPI0039EE9078